MDPDNRARALRLIAEARDLMAPEGLAMPKVEGLKRLTGCPHVWSYLFFENPRLTDVEVLEKALQYRIIAL
ncbi:hypothetical protein ACFPIJ_16785 [Dactylosporangium cerinum]|uniref:Uncharacterized protein n=1 Tax=Dactylosporangium cerinum TaxID=1434730 RepID=A0ABV9VVR9_9ACTN